VSLFDSELMSLNSYETTPRTIAIWRQHSEMLSIMTDCQTCSKLSQRFLKHMTNQRLNSFFRQSR